MFTGIIQASGTVSDIQNVGGDKRFLINAPTLSFEGVVRGDSIAVNGVCLTAVEFTAQGFWTDVSAETIGCTTFANMKSGSEVNLEKSLTPQASLGGHLVSGHVDGVGEVTAIEQDARSVRFFVRAPSDIARFIAQKGSICIDGTSLTVNSVNGDVFDINIIPHTFENTLFHQYQVGSEVNLEVDVIARYVERLATYTADRSKV
jgi:riboflavin synthase